MVGEAETPARHDPAAAHRDQGAAGAVRHGAVDEPIDRHCRQIGLGRDHLDLDLDLDRHVCDRHAAHDQHGGHGDPHHQGHATAYAANALAQPTAQQRERLPSYAGRVAELERQVAQVAAVARPARARVGEQAEAEKPILHASLGFREARAPVREPSAAATERSRAVSSASVVAPEAVSL